MSGEPLYALGEALSAVMAEIEVQLEANDGEFTPEMQAMLDAVEMPWEDKVSRVALYYRGLLASAAAVKSEESRLEGRRRAKEREAESLRAYLGRELAKQQRERVDTSLVTVRLQKNNPAASATTYLELLDPRWVRSRTELSLDKEAVLAAWRAQEELPEGITVNRSTSVRIA